jgi:hypothetical protein
MTATVQIWEMTSDTQGVDKTSDTVRFKSADETSVDSNNRLQIPGAGEDWSYTKQLRANITVAPSVDCTNLRAYTDGSNDFGTGVNVDYDTQQTWQTQTDADISGTDLFTKTSGAAIDMDQTNDTDGKTDTGNYGDHLRLQMGVTNTASPGALTPETLTFAYDET